MDGGIKFWLNPSEQDLYRPGWYSIDELISWAHHTGPVLIEAFEDAVSYPHLKLPTIDPM